jgi:hypothetical protein
MNELDPMQIINKTIQWWWIIAVAIFVGGALGFVFSTLQKPVYEATARFYVTVDISKYGLRDITERDEDLALASVENALWSTEVIQAITQESRQQNLNVNMATLVQDASTERGNAYWYLRYRNTNPVIAQKFVNLWAQKGYEAVLAGLANHTLVDYVKFNPPILASLPTTPVEYGRNKLMMAGAFLGLIAGVTLYNSFATRATQ